MKNLKVLFTVLCVACATTVWGEDFTTSYSYGNFTGWSLTNYSDKSSYYLVPSGTSPSVATISGIFTNKTITSDVVITINCATYGSGNNPSASTFSVYAEDGCTTSITATQSGKLPTSSTYTDVVYTITKQNTTNLTKDLAIKITKPGKQIRLKSVTVVFSYTDSSGSGETTNYTVQWMVGGAEYTDGNPTTSVASGSKVTTLPTAPDGNAIGPCANTFMGWSTHELGSETDQPAPTDLFTTIEGSPDITQDTIFYAVFATGTTN